MKVLSLLASPHRNGNTATILNSLLKGIKENGMKVNEVFLQGLNISSCRACDFCHNSPEGKCIICDDMQDVYLRLLDSDLIIFATPVYWWNMSAQLKIVMDRIYALMPDENSSMLKGKQAIILMTYGGELPNSGPEIVEKSLRESLDYLGIKVLDVLSVCSEKPVKDNEEALSGALNCGKNIRG